MIDILAERMQFEFSVFDMICQLIYSRIICPCSTPKTVASVFPYLYGAASLSEDQVEQGLRFIGGSYKKYVELFNHCYEMKFNKARFDQANFYYEIDSLREDINDPIITQSVLLDADLVPLAMLEHQERHDVRKAIDDMK